MIHFYCFPLSLWCIQYYVATVCAIFERAKLNSGARLVHQKAYFAELEGINNIIWQCCIFSAK